MPHSLPHPGGGLAPPARIGKVAFLGYGRFGAALGSLLRDAGISVRAFDPSAGDPRRRAGRLAPGARGRRGPRHRRRPGASGARGPPVAAAAPRAGADGGRRGQREERAGERHGRGARREPALGGDAPAVRSGEPRPRRAPAARRRLPEPCAPGRSAPHRRAVRADRLSGAGAGPGGARPRAWPSRTRSRSSSRRA